MSVERWRPFAMDRWGNVSDIQGEVNRLFDNFFGRPAGSGAAGRIWAPPVDLYETKDDLVQLLRSAYDAFGDVLSKMRDKMEFGLKVLWDRDSIVKDIEEDTVRKLWSAFLGQAAAQPQSA